MHHKHKCNENTTGRLPKEYLGTKVDPNMAASLTIAQTEAAVNNLFVSWLHCLITIIAN